MSNANIANFKDSFLNIINEEGDATFGNELNYQNSCGYFEIQDETRVAIVMTSPYRIWIISRSEKFRISYNHETMAWVNEKFRLLNMVIEHVGLHSNKYRNLIWRYNEFERKLRVGIDRRFISDIDLISLEATIQDKLAEYYYGCLELEFAHVIDLSGEMKDILQPTLLIQILREMDVYYK